MIAFVFATTMEAAPLIALLGASGAGQVVSETTTVFVRAGHRFAVSIVGVGKTSAGQGTVKLLNAVRPRLLVNLGIAGSLSSSADICEVYRVRRAVSWPDSPEHPVAFRAEGFEDLAARDLVTVDEPVFDDGLRRDLSAFGEMVDMEGTAIASAALAAGIPCIALKAISDQAGSGDQEMLRRNLKQASEKLADLVAKRRFPG